MAIEYGARAGGFFVSEGPTSSIGRQGSEKIQTSVVLIGAGGTGWSVANELTKRGHDNIILDKDPPGDGSSIANQGWGHSGALFVGGAIPDPITAEYCRLGSRHMLAYYKEAIQQETTAKFLYAHREQLEELIERCRKFDIEARQQSVRRIEMREPILKGSPLRFAASLPDFSFNNALLLQTVADHACAEGTRFCQVGTLECITGMWDGEYWHLFLDQDREIVCKVILLTCGVYIPEMLEKLLPGQSTGFLRTKHPVLVLRSGATIARSMLLTILEPDGIHLVPFGGSGTSGVTVCCTGYEETITDYRDYGLPLDWQTIFSERLQDYYPGLMDLAANNTILAHIYACQKLQQVETCAKTQGSRQPFCKSYAPEDGAPKNVLVAYPGKLTTASLLAEMCADIVQPLLEGYQHTIARGGTPAPRIARQRYYRDPKYRLTTQNGRLIFKALP